MSIAGAPESVNRSGPSFGPSFGAVAGSLAVGWLALRALLVAGVDLGKDEVAYWYWAGHLDASYAFVPLAAIRLADAAAGASDLALRLPFLLAGTAALALMYRLCREHGLTARRSLYAAAALGGTHWVWHTSSFLHPDGFLVPAWLLTLLASERARRGAGDAWWAMAGVGAGLTALSKYSGLVLGAGWLAALLVHRPAVAGTRQRLLAAAPAAALTAPLLYDLLRTDLALPQALTTLSAVAPASALARLPLFLLAPLLYVSPLLLGLLYRGLWRRLRAGSLLDADRFLLWPALGLLALFGAFALGNGQVKGNWILPAFLGLWPAAFAPQAASPGRASTPGGPVARRFPALLLAAGLLQAVGLALCLRVPAGVHWLSEALPDSWDRSYAGTVSAADRPREPTHAWTERVCEYHGWEGFGNAVDDAVEGAGIDGPVVAASGEYGLAFGLARYARRVGAAVVPGDPRFARLTPAEVPAVWLWARRTAVALDASAPPPAPGDLRLTRAAAGCPPLPYEVSFRPLLAPAPPPR